jgi:AraC-like DNA-binding protein
MTDLERLHELCRLRSTLEAFAVRGWPLGAARSHLERELRRCLAELKRHSVAGNYAAFHAADRDFHRVAVEGAGLQALSQSWELVSLELDTWILAIKHSCWPNLMALYREHELLLRAWCGKDANAAELATHQHIEAGWHRRMMTDQNAGTELDPVERTVSFIATHYDRPLDVAWLAANVSFVSPGHLGRLFRKQLGGSPLRHLKQVRLECAAQLLWSGVEAVADVARRVGYRNASHFVRDFRRMFGVTPLTYRRRGKG